MAAVRDYLQLARAQTAAVEGAGFPLAAWIGGAPLWVLPLFALYGILAHFGGFGENSFSDLSYDRSDPSKADHPLVAGRMTQHQAAAFVYGSQLAAFVLYVGVLDYRGLALLPLGAFLGYQLLGHAYNFLGKANKPAAVLEISGAFGLAFLASGSAWTGHAPSLVWAVTGYGFVMTAFQIAIAGELKELAQPNERNLLRRLGSKAEPFFGMWMAGVIEDAVRGGATVVVSKRAVSPTDPFLFTSDSAYALGFALSWAKAMSLAVIAWLVGGVVWGLAVLVVSLAMLAGYNFVLLRPGPYDRPRRLRIMGLGEAGSYLLLVFAVVPLVWPWLLVAFLALPVLWFGSLNRLLWARTGSAWAPGV